MSDKIKNNEIKHDGGKSNNDPYIEHRLKPVRPTKPLPKSPEPKKEGNK